MLVKPVLPRELPADVRDVLRRYTREVSDMMGAGLSGLLLYGSAARGEYLPGRSNLNLLLLVVRHDLDVLARYAVRHRRWARERIVAPLVRSVDELTQDRLLFPLELTEIRDAHLMLAGEDPFAELQSDLGNLPRQCAAELHMNLLRLRQRFMEGGGQAEAISMLLPLSLTGLLTVLRGIVRWQGGSGRLNTDAVLHDLTRMVDVDLSPLQEVWNLKRGLLSPGRVELPRLFARYVGVLQELVDRINRLGAGAGLRAGAR